MFITMPVLSDRLLGHGDAKWLSGIETGQRTTRTTSIEKLAEIFGVSVADLLAENSPLDKLATDDQSETT